MLEALVLASLATTTLPPTVPVAEDSIDVAYEQLTSAQSEAAIDHLEQQLERVPGEPAVLINLGSAYQRAGRYDEARDAFERAAASRVNYDLEMADGTWAASRTIAQAALRNLLPAMLASR